MLLAVDVGNTHVVLGLYRGEELLRSWRLQSNSKRTVDEFGNQIVGLLANGGYQLSQVKRVIVSCVVPPLSRVFAKLAQKYFAVEAIMVGPGVKTGLAISVDDPRTVGSDRIVNAVAAKELYGVPAIVVDFGTATTFDVVTAPGRYEGGVIAPGLLISAEALFERAAMLPHIELDRPEAVLGKNTRDSMLSGIYYGYVSLVDGIISRLCEGFSEEPLVVATGGLARAIADESRYLKNLAPDLTLDGLRIIAQLNA